MAFQLAQRTRIVVLMVPTWPESGFREDVARRGAGDRPGRARTATGATGRGEADEGEGRVLGR